MGVEGVRGGVSLAAEVTHARKLALVLHLSVALEGVLGRVALGTAGPVALQGLLGTR